MGTEILRLMRYRVSSSGQSNDFPLKVTSTGCSAIRSPRANSNERSSLYSRMKNCSISSPPPSHHAKPDKKCIRAAAAG